jgi:hypothetical protein
MRKVFAQLITTLIVASTSLAGQFQNAPNANTPDEWSSSHLLQVKSFSIESF